LTAEPGTLFITKIFFSSVISRNYGVNGADPKKIDTRSVILDFDIFQQMTDPSFVKNLKEKTDNFLQKLIEHRETGKKIQNKKLKIKNSSEILSQIIFVLCRHVIKHHTL